VHPTIAFETEYHDRPMISSSNLKNRTSNTHRGAHEVSLMMTVVKGLGVDVADDHGMGRRWNDE